MALASGDGIVKWGDWTQLESSGSSVSAGNMSAKATTECTPTQHENAHLVQFGVSAEFGANTPTQGKHVELYARINDIGAASQDGNVPTVAHKKILLGSAVLKAVSGTQYLFFRPIALPSENFDVYVFNGDDTDAMTWKLWVRGKSAGAKA